MDESKALELDEMDRIRVVVKDGVVYRVGRDDYGEEPYYEKIGELDR